jgi:DNA replication protein DnaC
LPRTWCGAGIEYGVTTPSRQTDDSAPPELVRPDVLILDDFAMRQLSAAQADDLYELVSERQGRSLIITSNRALSDWYPLFPTPSSPSHSWTGSSTPATRSS